MPMLPYHCVAADTIPVLLLLLQVPAQPAEAGPVYLKVSTFEFKGYPQTSLKFANEAYLEAKQAVEQQQLALLTGKVRPSTERWSQFGVCCMLVV
jgi:hypothetical protein